MAQTEVWLRSYVVLDPNPPHGPIPGTGTVNDPFDASTADLFDGHMRDFYDDPTNIPYYIHFGIGTFLTKGGYRNATTGWRMGNGWTIAGAGVGATTVQLADFNLLDPTPPVGQGKRFVIGALGGENNENLVVRDLTIDANWPGLAGKPADGKTAVLSIGIYTIGNATVENVRSINTYGDERSNSECFSIFLSHPDTFDENDVKPSMLSIRNCVAEQGWGDYVVGMTAFSKRMVDMRGNVCRNLPNGFPPGVYDGINYPNGANPSSAYQFSGRGITFVDNKSYNCPAGLYFDTGNIYDVLIAHNQFFGCGWGGLLAISNDAFFAFNLRKNDVGGSLDGMYVDIPVKPAGGSDSYRVRVWLSNGGSTANQPANPGTLIQVNYPQGGTRFPIQTLIADALVAYTMTIGSLFTNIKRDYNAVAGQLAPGIAVWAGNNGMSVSDSAVWHAQRGYEFRNWVIDNNFIEIVNGYWNSVHQIPQTYGVCLKGTGVEACRDYTVTNNYVHFTGLFTGSENHCYATGRTAGHLSMIGNRTDYQTSLYGTAFGRVFIDQLPGSTHYYFGNRIVSGSNPGEVIPGLEDTELHVNRPGLGATTVGGAILANTTPAGQSGQQVSPALHWVGNRWLADSGLETGGLSQSVEFRVFTLPHAYYNPPIVSSEWRLECSIGGGTFAPVLSVSERGNLQIGQTSTNEYCSASVAGNFLGYGLGISPSEGPNAYPPFITLDQVGWWTGATAPAATATSGSFYSRIAGGAASGLYVRTNGTWIQVINPASPGPIGSGTPDTGAFTTISGNGANITALDANKVTAGTLAIARGGTGIGTAPTSNGQILIGSSGGAYSVANLTAGSGITITNGAGTITIAETNPFNPASPGTIGGGTPGAGTFTALTATSGSSVTLSPSVVRRN